MNTAVKAVAIGMLGLCIGVLPVTADTLKSAVQQALSSNPTVKAADANMRALTYDLLEQDAGYQPSVRLFGSAGVVNVDDPQGLSAADNARTRANGEIGLVASLTLFDGYRRANQVYASAARVDQGAFELLDASETMALMVTEQYINIARQQHLLKVAQASLQRLRKIDRQAATLVEGGRLPASARFQVEANVLATQSTIADIQLQLSDATARYKQLVGKPAHAGFPIPSVVQPHKSIETFVQQAINNSYRVKIASKSVDVRGFEQQAADADFAPQLSLNGGVSAGENLDGSPGSESNVFLGVELSWQLSRAGRYERQQAFGERRNAALYDRMAVVREVEALANVAWHAFLNNTLKLDLARSQARSYRNLKRSYEQEFELGTRTVLDLLIAENRLFNGEVDEVNNRAILSFSGYRALATQSKLAKFFGVKQADRVLAQTLDAKSGDKPRVVIQNGRVIINQ